MTLYVLDSDLKKGTEEQGSDVVYNFPEEFVRKGEIELKKDSRQPVKARFILKLLPSTENNTGAGE